MNKYIKTTLFTIASFFLILITSCKDMNNSATTQEGKARIYFGIEQTAQEPETILESARAGGISDTQKISGGQLDLNEMDYIALYHGDMGTSMIQMDCKEFQTQGSSTAYQQFTQTSMELNYGHYHFILEVYKGSNRYLVAEIPDCEVTKNTTKIIFQTFSTYTDNTSQKSLKLYFTDNTNTVSKIKVNLYSSMYDTATGLIDTADLTLSDVEGFATQVFAYEKTGITNERCFLVYEMFTKVQLGYEVDDWGDTVYEKDDDGNYIYDEYNMLIPIPKYEFIHLNKVGPLVVELTSAATQATINIESGEINTIPQDAKTSGTFIPFNPSITFEVLEQSEKFYLNTGILKIKIVNDYGDSYGEHQTKAKLLYNGVEVDKNFYYASTISGTDVTVKFELSNDKRLPVGGHYQLFIQVPQEFQVGEDEIKMFASKTCDIEVIDKEYYEYNLADYVTNDAGSALEKFVTAVRSDIEKLRNNADIRVYGNATDTNPQSYFSQLSYTLDDIKNYYIDLDMSQAGKLSTMKYDDNISCDSLRSLKLPAQTYTIQFGSIRGNNLETLYICEDGGNQENGGRHISEQAFSLPKLKQFIIEKEPETPCNCSTIADGKVLLQDLYDLNGDKIGNELLYAAPSLTELDLTGAQVVSIGNSAFYESSIQTITGTDTVQNISAQAFYKAASIQSFDMKSVVNIGYYAFCESGLTTIENWGYTQKTIGNTAFQNSKLTTLPDLSKISSVDGGSQFADLTNLDTVVIDDSFIAFAKKYDSSVFTGCQTENVIVDTVLNLADGEKGLFGKSTIDDYDYLQEYLNSSFKVTNKLTFNKDVTLKDLSDSSKGLFWSSYNNSNDSIKEIEFKGKSIIGKFAFYETKYLTKLTFTDENATTKNMSEIGEEAFYCGSNTYGINRSVSNLTLTGVRKICTNGLHKWNQDGTLTIPDSLIAIQKDAFKDLGNVTVSYGESPVGTWIALQGRSTTEGEYSTYNSLTADNQIQSWLNNKPSSEPVNAFEESAEPKPNPKIYVMGHNPALNELNTNYITAADGDDYYDSNGTNRIWYDWLYRYISN